MRQVCYCTKQAAPYGLKLVAWFPSRCTFQFFSDVITTELGLRVATFGHIYTHKKVMSVGGKNIKIRRNSQRKGDPATEVLMTLQEKKSLSEQSNTTEERGEHAKSYSGSSRMICRSTAELYTSRQMKNVQELTHDAPFVRLFSCVPAMHGSCLPW